MFNDLIDQKTISYLEVCQRKRYHYPYSKEKMPKLRHKIVLFIEHEQKPYRTPLKIGNLFMNRFSIDEDANFEISNIFHLECTLRDIYYNYSEEKGLDFIILKVSCSV